VKSAPLNVAEPDVSSPTGKAKAIGKVIGRLYAALPAPPYDLEVSASSLTFRWGAEGTPFKISFNEEGRIMTVDEMNGHILSGSDKARLIASLLKEAR
jgi:hypothetical protein